MNLKFACEVSFPMTVWFGYMVAHEKVYLKKNYPESLEFYIIRVAFAH